MSKEALDAAGTRIVVIGCGDWPVIKTYKGSLPFLSFFLGCKMIT